MDDQFNIDAVKEWVLQEGAWSIRGQEAVFALIEVYEAARQYRLFSTCVEYGDGGLKALERLAAALARFK